MSMLPRRSSRDAAPNSPNLSPGTICLYENDGRALVGVITGMKHGKYLVLNQRGRESELQSFRIHPLPGRMPGTAATTADQVAFLEQVSAESTTAATSIPLEELWNVVIATPREYTSSELAALYYTKVELKSYLALRLALIGDRIFFKRGDEGFSPRPVEIVEELKKSERSRLERVRLYDLAIKFFIERMRIPTTPIPGEIEVVIRTLLEVAAGCSEIDNGRLREAKELVDSASETIGITLSGSREQRIVTFLEKVRILDANTNLAFVRERYNLSYDSQALEMARTVSIPNSWQELTPEEQRSRVDFTALACFTIDDVSTRDMDDAISIERRDSGFRLGIHISDVAHFVTPGSALERAAMLRATSIYCPERTVNMLPDILAEDLLSLVAGKVRYALSCLIDIDHSLAVTNYSITPSLIRVTKRYTYQEVDDLLYREDSELHPLYNIASGLEAVRIERGALRIGKREIIVTPRVDGGFDLVEIDENSPSRSTIGEMMVLGNSILADYGVRNKLPLIFRGQEGPDTDLHSGLSTIPAGPARDYTVRSRLKKSYTAVEPVRHSSLAVDAYIQATSPIRRFADLINQRQISHYIIHGKPAHTAAECLELMEKLGDPLSKAQSISKTTRRFWQLRYLEELAAAGKAVHATVIRTDLRNPLIEIEEIVMPTLLRIDRPVRPGDRLELRITRVDARTDYLRLEAVQ